MPEPACSCPGKHMRASRWPFIQLLRLSSSFSRKVRRLCWLSGFVRTRWRNISGISVHWEGEMTTLTSMHLGTMPTHSEARGQFPVKVEMQEAGKTNIEHGWKLLMQHCLVGKNRNSVEWFGQNILLVWINEKFGIPIWIYRMENFHSAMGN